MVENNREKIAFRKANFLDKELLEKWFAKPHVQEFWDNSSEMWENVVSYLNGKKILYDYWIALFENIPFSLVITSDAAENDPTASGSNHLLPYLDQSEKTWTIDFMIGEESFLGKGLSYLTLQKFTLEQKDISSFLIDPEVSNTKAIHVYEKAGFEEIATYTPKEGYFKGKKHIIMKKRQE